MSGGACGNKAGACWSHEPTATQIGFRRTSANELRRRFRGRIPKEIESPLRSNSMALSVLNNIASLAAQNQLTITNGNLQKALFQLSSGSRINTGADDAAGLAIADGLHANITALTQSSRNANDGVGKLQVADGALAQVTTLLNRAVTLATEAATGTVSQSQRGALDAEFSAIKAEIDRIGGKTTFNGTAVFQSATQPNLNEQDSVGSLALNNILTVGQSTTITSGAATFTYTAATT